VTITNARQTQPSASEIVVLLQDARACLTGISDTPRLDAEVLLAHVLRQSRSYLYTWPQRTLSCRQRSSFSELLIRRLRGEPLAYLVGQREFWSLPLWVTPATLIPRPETELLVELALERLPFEAPLPVADLGTGSGAIALAIACERPKTKIVATDISHMALTVAKSNAQQLAISNVVFRQGNWCKPLANESFTLITCNPPYLADNDPHLCRSGLHFEPTLALLAGNDGLREIYTIVPQAMAHLQPGGWLLLEHGYDQGEKVFALLQKNNFIEITQHQDAANINRVSIGRRPEY
jgi:release factor glutamine methyltransferase